jgi:hypothetical protein
MFLGARRHAHFGQRSDALMKRTHPVSSSNVVVPYGDFDERRDRRRRVVAELERQDVRRTADAEAAARRISRDQKFQYTRPGPVTQRNPDHVAGSNRCEWTGVWDAHPRRHDTYLRDPGYIQHSVSDETD